MCILLIQSNAELFSIYFYKYEVVEEELLSVLVNKIDKEASIVPRGAYIRTGQGEIQQNTRFQGQ